MSHGARPHCVHELILEHPNFQRKKWSVEPTPWSFPVNSHGDRYLGMTAAMTQAPTATEKSLKVLILKAVKRYF